MSGSSLMKIKNFNFKVFSLVLTYAFWPPISMCVLLAVYTYKRVVTSIKVVKKVQIITFICMSTIVFFSMSTTLNLGGTFDFRDLKFLFYFLAFSLGFMTHTHNYRLVFKYIFYVLSVLLIFQFILYGWEVDDAERFVYLPDKNNLMITFSFLFPAVIYRSKFLYKIQSILLAILIMLIIGSRSGMGLVILISLISLFDVRNFKRGFIYISSVLSIALIVIFDEKFDLSSFYEINNYSDQVRLMLYAVGMESFLSSASSSYYLLGLGHDFTSIYENYTDLPIAHVHNLYLQVLITSGIVSFFCIFLMLFSWIYFSLKNKNYLLFIQIIVIMVLGMVETIYSDSRVFMLICMLVGMSFTNYKRSV